MFNYEKVFEAIAYLIETMNNFDDEVLRYKYSKVLLHYKNYIENYIGENDIRGEIKALLYIKKNAKKHLNYIYFPHLENKKKRLELVNIETVSQLQHELLVRAGMPITIEPIASDGVKVTFNVTSEVAEKYNSLLEFCIDEYKAIIAQSE